MNYLSWFRKIGSFCFNFKFFSSVMGAVEFFSFFKCSTKFWYLLLIRILGLNVFCFDVNKCLRFRTCSSMSTDFQLFKKVTFFFFFKFVSRGFFFCVTVLKITWG